MRSCSQSLCRGGHGSIHCQDTHHSVKDRFTDRLTEKVTARECGANMKSGLDEVGIGKVSGPRAARSLYLSISPSLALSDPHTGVLQCTPFDEHDMGSRQLQGAHCRFPLMLPNTGM